MQSQDLVVGLAVLFAAGGLASGQATPTPVISNIAVSSYAQGRGQAFANGTPFPCTTPGGQGCGGCYPVKIGAEVLDLLPEVNPEWQPIGPMISGGPDVSLPPESQPVTIHGTVELTKVNTGGDFPGSHLGDDQNTFIRLDDADNGFLATGNQSVVECGPPPGENCNLIEMELEFAKYPLFAWAGEGDRITAEGRWIFDCGHPDPEPLGGCSHDPSTPCIVDADCGGGGSQCNSAPPVFNYRSELHPPQAIAVLRNKSNGKTPATQADVYISADGGAAGDICTVTHLPVASDVLFKKNCFLNHCSVTTNRSCTKDEDCASGEQCIIYDARRGGPVANINAKNFEFDMPLPPPPSSSATLQIDTQSFQPPGSIMPEPVFTPPTPPLGPAPSLHVVVPMSVPLSTGEMPNVFAGRIIAYWKEDTTQLTHVQINFLNLRINNPLKAVTPVLDRVCTNPAGGLTATPCVTNTDCAAGSCVDEGTRCYSDQDCPSKTDTCSGESVCIGGLVPGWQLFGEVNGDWIEFVGLTSIGTVAPFGAPPYAVPTAPLVIPLENLTFDEYVPSTGSIHIATTGYSLGCNDANLYGNNLKNSLSVFGLNLGAACLDQTDPDPGRLDVTHTGPHFTAAPAGVTCVPPATSGPTICTATAGLGNGGTCSITTSRLCVVDADCPAGACSNNGAACHANEDCATGNTCTGAETCNATCSTDSGNAGASCHTDADCTNDGTCAFGGAFALEYSVCVDDCTATPTPTAAPGSNGGDGCAIAPSLPTATASTPLGLLAVLAILVGRCRRRSAGP
jgi:hypothetical protein